jgi:transcriptional regulator with XRE-family HTH domain
MNRFEAEVAREARRATGKSRTTVAAEIGVSSSMIQRYEGGAAEPAASRLALLAESLGVSADALLGVTLPEQAGDEATNVRRMFSVPLRESLRKWIKIEAARRGIKIQDLMDEIVSEAKGRTEREA